MICFSQKTPGFYSSNGLFKANTRKIPLSNHENWGGYVFGTGTHQQKSLAHRGQPTGSVLALNLVVERWAETSRCNKKHSVHFRRRFKLIFKKALDNFLFSTPPKCNMESEQNHLFNIFPIPILGFHVSFRGGPKNQPLVSVDSVGKQVIKGAGAVPTCQGVWTSDMPFGHPERRGKKTVFSWWFVDLAYWWDSVIHKCMLSWRKYLTNFDK